MAESKRKDIANKLSILYHQTKTGDLLDRAFQTGIDPSKIFRQPGQSSTAQEVRSRNKLLKLGFTEASYRKMLKEMDQDIEDVVAGRKTLEEVGEKLTADLGGLEEFNVRIFTTTGNFPQVGKKPSQEVIQRIQRTGYKMQSPTASGLFTAEEMAKKKKGGIIPVTLGTAAQKAQAAANRSVARGETEAQKAAKAAKSAELMQRNLLGQGKDATPSGATPTKTTIDLKNQGIADANPAAVANKNYINALYKEAYNRDATQRELDRFDGSTVKDAANIILGAEKSPFFGTATADATPTSGQATLTSPDGSQKTVVNVGSDDAAKLQKDGWSIGDTGKTVVSVGDALGGGDPADGGTKEAPFSPEDKAKEADDAEKKRAEALKNALAMIDASNLPDELKSMYKMVVQNYPEGVEVNPQEILSAFNKIKDETIDPYFKNLVSQATADMQNQFTSLEQQRALELEQERALAGRSIRQASEGLEQSGMTFTGKAIEQLGAKSAYPQTGGVPGQVPFGGQAFHEGEVPQANRLLATSNLARYQSKMKQLGLDAEQTLGSEGIAGLGLSSYTPVGGVQGSIDLQKQQRQSSTLSNILDQYSRKQTANTNLNF